MNSWMDRQTDKQMQKFLFFGWDHSLFVCLTSHQTGQKNHTKAEKEGWTDGWMNGGQGLQVMHGAVNPTLPLFKTRIRRQPRAQTESRWSVYLTLPLLHHTSPLASPACPMSENCQQWINNPDIYTLSLIEQQFIWDIELHRVAWLFPEHCRVLCTPFCPHGA